MDVWFCAKQEPAERLNRELMMLQDTSTRSRARTDFFAPLDKDLSWRSATLTLGLLQGCP
jgi:hypothetical protein